MVRRNYLGVAEQRAEEVRRRLEDLQGRHLQLTVRATLLALLLRVRREIAAHWHRCGGDPAHGQLLEERAQALAQTGVATNSGGLEDRFEHLRPGVSLLQLESVTPARVEAVRRMTLPDVAAAMTVFYHRASGAAAMLSSRGVAPQHVEAARAIVCAVGRDLQELRYMLMIWNAPVYHAFVTHRFDTLDPVTAGGADAPTTQWDVAARALGLFREQALLQIDNGRLLRQRQGRVRAERGSLLRDFSAVDEQGTGGAVLSKASDHHQPMRMCGVIRPQPQLCGGAGDASGGGDCCDGCCDGDVMSSEGPPSQGILTLEELVDRLETNTTSEGVLRMEGIMLAYVLLTPLQAARLLCSVYPFPGHLYPILDSIAHLLRTRPEELPWAGTPMHMGPANEWTVSSCGQSSCGPSPD